MQRSFLALMFVTSLSSFPALAKDVSAQSEITKAIVYSDRATLTRRAVVEIPAGAHNLVFSGVPVNIYTDSLRVEGNAKVEVIFGALSHKRESFQDYVAPREKELNQKLVTLQDQRKVFNADKQALRAGQEFLKNIGKQATLRTNEDVAEINLKPESWAAAADSLTSKMSQNLKASLELDVKTRDVNKQIQQVQNELRELRTGHKQSYSVTIPYEADKPTTLTVDLSYQQTNVGWQPTYDARLDTKSGDMDLVQYGSVWQKTGEDWTDIALTLSTAQPSRGTDLPDLYTNWVNIIKPMPMRKKGMVMSMSAPAAEAGVSAAYIDAIEQQNEMDLEEAMHDSAIPVPIETKTRSAQINADGYVGEYIIKGPSTVKSNGEQAKLLVGNFETDSAMQVQIKPQIGHEAYLVVNTTLKGEAPILPGQVSLFRDGAFIGKGHLPMLRPGDMEGLGFGVDDNVTISRNTLKDERSEAGIISKEVTLERHYVTEIQNLHKTGVEIAILETVPVSQDQRINIEFLAEKTTAGYEKDVDDVKGLTRWTQTLKPKEKSKINLGWKVTWPKGENISGL
ncbi:MAG: mucoidy inhibitor MuiA family protein [Alphaproteobacteria bacterium]